MVENVGEGIGDHALMPSSEVVLVAESWLERRATKVVKLNNCELPALVELPAKLCGRFALELHVSQN